MKKITYSEYGPNHNTQLTEMSELQIQTPHQVLIKIKAASINPVDWKIRTGEMRLFTGSQFPRGMGCDFSGIVESIGANVTRFKNGDRVFGFLPFKVAGSFAEKAITTEDLLGKIPDTMTFEEAACLPMAGAAALTALTLKAQVHKNDRVFIGGCTGGVGNLSVQLAKSLGATVVGSCHPDDFEIANAIGVDEVYDYAHYQPQKIGKCQIVFDTSGKMRRAEVLALLPNGIIPFTVKGKFIDLNPKPAAMIRSIFSSVHKVVITKVTSSLIKNLESLVYDKKIKPIIGQIFEFNESVQIINEFEKGKIKTKGKIVFKI